MNPSKIEEDTNSAEDYVFHNYVYNRISIQSFPNRVLEILNIRNGAEISHGQFGVSLRQLVSSKEWIPHEKKDVIMDIAIAAAECVCDLHTSLAVVGRISPDTLFWDGGTTIKYCDFSFASIRAENCLDSFWQGILDGCFQESVFIAPEILMFVGDVNICENRFDQFSLGMVFFYLITAKIPRDITEAQQILENMTDFHPSLVSIVSCLTCQSPMDRYRHIDWLKEDLIRARRSTTPFALSNQKIHSLCEPQKMYRKLFGRAKHLQTAMSLIEQSTGSLLIYGESRMGKSFLLTEIKRWAYSKGIMVGKVGFESSIAEIRTNSLSVLRSLVDGLSLYTSQESWRTFLETNLKEFDSEAVCNIVSSAAKHTEEDTRITDPVAIMSKILNYFVSISKSKSVVLLFDDVNRACMCVFELLKSISSGNIPGVVAVATCNPSHVTSSTSIFDEWASQSTCISLDPLVRNDISSWVSQHFGLDLFNQTEGAKAEEIVSTVVKEAGYCPADIQSFFEQKFEGRIPRKIVPLQDKFPEPCLQALKIIACYGQSIPFKDLKMIIEGTSEASVIPYVNSNLIEEVFGPVRMDTNGPVLVHIGEILLPAFESDFLVHGTGRISFGRGSLYSSLLDSMDSKEVRKIRFLLACLFLDCPSRLTKYTELFMAAGHEEILSCSEELLIEVVKSLNTACRQSTRHHSYELAKTYGNYALAFLKQLDSYSTRFKSLFLKCCLDQISTLSALDSPDAEDIFAACDALENLDETEQLEVLHSRSIYYSQSGQLMELVDVAKKGIKILKLESIPLTGDELEKEIVLIRDQIEQDICQGGKLWKANEWPLCKDTKHSFKMMWMSHITRNAYPIYEPINAWILFALRSLKYLLARGDFVQSTPSILSWVAAAFAGRNEPKLAGSINSLALELLPRIHASGPHDELLCLITLNHFTMHWILPLRKIVDYFGKVIDIGEFGLYPTVIVYSKADLGHVYIASGEKLEPILREVQSMDANVQSGSEGFRNNFFLPGILSLVMHLTGKTENPGTLSWKEFDEESHVNNIRDNHPAFQFFIQSKVTSLFWAGKAVQKQAIEWACKISEIYGGEENTFLYFFTQFYAALIFIQASEITNGQESLNFVGRAEKICDKMKVWADTAPFNYLAMYLITKGELSRIQGEHKKSWQYLNYASLTAKRNNLIHLEALSLELIGDLLFMTKSEPLDDFEILNSIENGCLNEFCDFQQSSAYYEKALVKYWEWGCTVRLASLLDRIKDSHPDVVKKHSSKNSKPILQLPFIAEYLDRDIPVGIRVTDFSEVKKELSATVKPFAGTDWRPWIRSHPEKILAILSKRRVIYENAESQRLMQGRPNVKSESFLSSVVNMFWIVENNGSSYETHALTFGEGENQRVVWSRSFVPESERESLRVLYTVLEDITSTHWLGGQAKKQTENKNFRELEITSKERVNAIRQSETLQREKVERKTQIEQAHMEFVDTLCHEIRNPLNGIIAGLELLRSNAITPESSEDCLNDMNSCAAHLRVIVDDVLDFSKLNSEALSIQKVPYSPLSVLKSVSSMFQPAIRNKSIKYIETISHRIIPEFLVFGDPNRLVQVLANLISNAVKFTPYNGTIWSTTSVDMSTKRINISVKDTGIGMSEKVRENLFMPFMATRSSPTSSFGGSGLGLVISKRLVTMMGGELFVDSIESQGTEFIVGLPLEIASKLDTPVEQPLSSIDMLHRFNLVSSTPNPDAPENSERDPASLKILVVDDVAVNRRVLKGLLYLLGYRNLVFAENGKEAVELVVANSNVFDIIFMDLDMPVLDGYAATIELRKWESDTNKMRKIEIIALSGYSSGSHKNRAFDVGMTGYLTKPVSLGAISGVLQGK